MKPIATAVILSLCTLTLFIGMAQAGEAHPMKSASGWFDFENCAFCKNLTEEPELMHHATWENHAIKNGMMNVTTVEPAYAEALATAEKKMNELGMKMQSGEVNPMGVTMCKSCQTWGMLMMSGVDMERVEGDAATITMFTSDDPALVKRLQELSQRNNEEMALLMGAGHDEGKDHSGHDHDHSGHKHH